MARRKAVNVTGISRRPNIPTNDAWIAYKCINCGEMNFVKVGKTLLTPRTALETCCWTCSHCHFVHSKDSDLPEGWGNWEADLKKAGSSSNESFWRGFFTNATENPESYWKQCNVCGRILPSKDFSKHKGFGVLEKQLECRACKGAINAVGNPKRTAEQMLESSAGRRLADLLAGQGESIDIEDLFARFGGKCFKTGVPLDINDRGSWHVDHILPSKYFYPLTKRNAALLSAAANENKKDQWPSQFYTPQELVELSNITGADLDLISSKEPVYNKDIDVNGAVTKYLTVRNSGDLANRVEELKKLLTANNLVSKLNDNNKKRLGF